MRHALITGIGGQDGSYLAELLLEKGYRVIGTVKDGESDPVPDHLHDTVDIVGMDLGDIESVKHALGAHEIHEVYNFAAFTSGEGMFTSPVESGDINGLAVTRLLESIREVDSSIRFCQASSSEMFGNANEAPQTEASSFHPRTPYGAAKLYAHNMIDIYRNRYGIHACSAILYNHESPRRGLNFVTRKVTHGAASIKLGLADKLTLGTLDARRDWDYAKDYVSAMHMMLTHDHPGDYIVATGQTHSIRKLCELAFGYLDLDFREYVEVDTDAQRAPEKVQLVGDASKAHRILGWRPTLDFSGLIRHMVDHDLALLRAGQK
jgi:GDPmannose 4,6-dehydratase